MNRLKRTPEHATDSFLPGSAFSTRQITAMVVAILLAVVLYPLGANAMAFMNVIITDPTNTANQAHVDDHGDLHVAGNVGLTGTPMVGIDPSANVVRDADEPARQVFQRTVHPTLVDNASIGSDTFSVPVGRRLAIQFVSAEVLLPAGQSPEELVVETVANGVSAGHVFAPAFTASVGGASDRFVVSQDASIYADPGTTVTVELFRNSSSGNDLAAVTVSGYLVNCSVGPCA
jgi:hypothetical protein